MSDEIPDSDVPDVRQQFLNSLAISELDYVVLLDRSVAHAVQPRPAAAAPPWVCVGPRNLGGRILSFVQDPVNANTLYAGSAHGGLWRSHDGGDTWVHLGDVEYNGPVGALALHRTQRGLLIMGTGAPRAIHSGGIGLWRVRVTQHDDSAVFERLAPAPPPESAPAAAGNGAAARYSRIEFDPEDSRQFWAASQTGLWRCLVEPANGSVPAWTRDFPPAVAPAGTALATQLSLAQNPSWPPYASDLRVAIDPRVTETMAEGDKTLRRYLVIFLAVDSAGIFRGRYDRKSKTVAWDPVLSVPNPALGNPFGRGLVSLCRGDPNHVYAVFENQTGNNVAENNHATNVYHSSDCGNTWSAAPTAAGRIPRAFRYTDAPGSPTNGQANYSMVLEVHPTSPQVVACGEIDLCLSTDNGRTWTPIMLWQTHDGGDYAQHGDQHVAWFDLHDRRRLWSGNDGGLSVARDLTAPAAAPGFWRKRSHGIVAAQFQDVTTHPNPLLSSISGGGLQDNGTWLSFGGPTWHRIGGGDGGALAVHAADPRRYLYSVQFVTRLGFVAAGPPTLIVNPVAADLPIPLQTMHVGQSANDAGGPFVPIQVQSPATPGEMLVAWKRGAPLQTAFFLNPPAGNVKGVATAIALPAPAVDAGVEGTAVAYGPVVPLPGTLEAWIGLSDGRLFHTAQAPNTAPWTNVPALPVPGGVRHGITRIATHPTNPAIVAVSTVALDRAIELQLTTAGAPGGAARFNVRYWHQGAFGPFGAPVPVPVGPLQVPGTSIIVTFAKAAYLATDVYRILVDGTIAVPGAATGLPADLRAASQAFVPVTVTITTAGVPGVARFSFQAAGLTSVATTVAAVDLGATGLVLRFAGGPFVVGHSWVIATSGTVTPAVGAAGTVEVLARLHSRVFLSYNRGANWFDISFPRTRPAGAFGADSGSLTPGPVAALLFDINGASLDLCAGTLAGVYRTTGLPVVAPVAPGLVDTAWRPFNGPAGATLPLTLASDLEPIAGTRRLRAATFGRGIWDCDLAGAAATPRLLIRQTLIEDGRTYPRVFPHPLLPDDPRHVAGAVWLDHAHAFDIRVDSAPFDFFDDRVDGVEFDERMGVDDLVPLAEQAVYVQVHNWGFANATNVDVHLLFAPAGVAGPVLVGGVAPVVSMPAVVPTADTLYALPDFNPSGASRWRRVGPPQRITRLKPWEPAVVRFDWRPPLALAGAAPIINTVALVALCTAVGDSIPAVALAAGTTLATWIAQERRAALRLVRIQPAPLPTLYVRDGVDDDARLGNVPFAGRSPDLICVQAAPPDPAIAFRDLFATRAQDRVLIGANNHVYVRVHNRGLAAAVAEVHVWTVALDAFGAPNFAPAGWTQLTPAAAPFLTLNVPAGGNALANVALNNPADPAPGSTTKSIALVALIRSTDGADRLPATAGITDVQKFWDFFGTLFNSDNAALRVLRAAT